MPSPKRPDSFISTLVEETYRSLPRHEMALPPGDLLEYFKKKDAGGPSVLGSIEFLAETGLRHWPLSWLPMAQCYRLILGERVLDFPGNWSIFAKAYEEGWSETGPEGEDSHLLQVLTALFLVPDADHVAVLHAREGALLIIASASQEIPYKNFRNAHKRRSCDAA